MKIQATESVVHEWVSTLTFQQQALLMTGMRGPDGSEKHNGAKYIVRYLRAIVLKPAGNWQGKNDNDFMWGDYTLFDHYAFEFWNNHDHYPHHFIMHLFHCAEVIGYKHPDHGIRWRWNQFYLGGCRAFHLNPETEEQMDNRLNDFKNKMKK